MICAHCGSKLVWQNDFDFEDFHLEGEGIVSFYDCSGCIASAVFYMPAVKN